MSLFLDMLADNTLLINRYVDFTFVVNITNNKELIVGLNHQFFEHFFRAVRETLRETHRDADIRAQIMWYRSHEDEYCGGESIFFKVPEEIEPLSKYIAGISSKDAIFKANSICGVLKQSLNYKFRNDGSKERQIIVFLSDKEDDVCATDMRESELSSLYSIWENEVEAAYGRRRRLCLITPCVYPYSEFEVDLEYTVRFDVGAGCSWAEWKDALDSLTDLIINFTTIC